MKSSAAFLSLVVMVMFASKSLGAPLPTILVQCPVVQPNDLAAIADNVLAHNPSYAQYPILQIISTVNDKLVSAKDLSAASDIIQEVATANNLEAPVVENILVTLFTKYPCKLTTGLDLNALWDLLTLGLLQGVNLNEAVYDLGQQGSHGTPPKRGVVTPGHGPVGDGPGAAP